MLRKIIKLSWLLVAVIWTEHAAIAANVSDFADFSLRDGMGNVLLPGRLYSPPEALSNPSIPRPFILYLHGSSGDGVDNLAQLSAVSDSLVTAAKQQGAFLYLPQTPDNWASTTTTARIMTMVDRAVSERDADNLRIYITGYSNGGAGTWNMLSRYDGRFAAAMTVSSAALSTDVVAARLTDTPIFALHARDDTVAAVSNSRNAVNSVLLADHQSVPTYPALGNPSILFVSNPTVESQQQVVNLIHQQGATSDFFVSDPKLDLMYVETPSGGHDGLTGIYNFPQTYDWLFSHSLAVPEPDSFILATLGFVLATCKSRSTRRQACL